MKLLPSGKAESVASVTIDLRNHFGDQFNAGSADFEPAKEKAAKGIICHKLNYTADINILEPTDIQVFEKCVAWRQKIHQDKQYKEEYDNMKAKFI